MWLNTLAQQVPPPGSTPGSAPGSATGMSTGVSPEAIPDTASAGGALADAVRHLFEAMTSIFSRGDALASPEHLLPGLQKLGFVWALVLLTVGLLCMFNGYRWYKFATVTIALFIGLFAGYWLGEMIGAPFVVAGCLGALLCVMAFPLLKYMVAVLGGLAGAFIGANLWSGIAHAANKIAASHAAPGEVARQVIPADAYWVGALVGLIVCGMLAFILWKLSIVLYTSVSGSTLAVIGALALLLSVDPWSATVAEGLSSSQIVIPLLVFVPAAIGLILQETRTDPDPGRPA